MRSSRDAERFSAKFPALRTPAGDYHAYGVRLHSTDHVLRFYRALRGLGESA